MRKSSRNNCFVFKVIFFFAVSVLFSCLLSRQVYADSAEGEVAEIAVDERASPKFDIRVRVIWTGAGDRAEGQVSNWLRVRQGDFGEHGVNRVQSLLTAAFLSGKTVWLVFDENLHITSVFLRSTRGLD